MDPETKREQRRTFVLVVLFSRRRRRTHTTRDTREQMHFTLFACLAGSTPPHRRSIFGNGRLHIAVASPDTHTDIHTQEG